MKYYLSILLSVMVFAGAIAQINNNVFGLNDFKLLSGISTSDSSVKKNVDRNSLNVLGNIDCNTDFWTVNVQGDIQQWFIENNTVQGGDIIVTGAGSGLAYCGNTEAETFYCTNFPNTGISYYDASDGWITMPTDIPLLNNGGYLNDQYCFGLQNNSLKNLYYFNGFTFELLDSLTTEFFTAADVAVDTNGQAWVLKGNSEFQTSNLSVYNNSGFITSYEINFDSHGTYGAFFLNDILYIGRSLGTGNDEDDFIIPITISGTSAIFGQPINFPYYSYTDMASCNVNGLSIKTNQLDAASINVFPNPSNGIFNVSSKDQITSINVYSIDGKLLETIYGTNRIDLSALPNQSYILSIEIVNEVYKQIVIKK